MDKITILGKREIQVYKQVFYNRKIIQTVMTLQVNDQIAPPIQSAPHWVNQMENPEQVLPVHKQDKSKIPFVYKIVVALCFVIGYTIYRIFYVPFDNSKCLIDTYFEATYDANRWMRNTAADGILGAMQVIMDAWIIFAGVSWLILTKNMRFPLAAGIIFLFRAIFLNIQKLPFDDYIVWHSPGFLSFTVPYDRTRDFFFSGHTASLSIVTIQMFYLGWYKIGTFAVLNLIFMMNFLIISRVHYTIDVIAGVIFAITSYRMTVLIVKYEDFLLSIPFYIGRHFLKKYRKSDLDKEYQMIDPRDTQNVLRTDPNAGV